MKVALFVPCYVDQFFPQAAIATLQLLEKLGVTVEYPSAQVCCGQPMANAGFEHLTQSCNTSFVENFSKYQYIVCPSGSCTLHLKEHLHAEGIDRKIFELTEFLHDVMQLKKLDARFPHRVGLHQSCHGLRGLQLGRASELVASPFSKPEALLKMVAGIDLIELDQKDECCGFGGTFAVTEEAVSAKMGIDRVNDHARHQAEYITGVDMSCLMHLDGVLRRQKSPMKVVHIAEILNAQ